MDRLAARLAVDYGVGPFLVFLLLGFLLGVWYERRRQRRHKRMLMRAFGATTDAER